MNKFLVNKITVQENLNKIFVIKDKLKVLARISIVSNFNNYNAAWKPSSTMDAKGPVPLDIGTSADWVMMYVYLTDS